MSEKFLELADVIQALRENLIRAQEEADNKQLKIKFEVTDVEVELQTEITGEGKGDIKFGFTVLGTGVDAGIEGSRSKSTFHRVKLSLKPKKLKSDGTTGDFLINDEVD